VRTLTDHKNESRVETSAVSPDGRQVAYDWLVGPAQPAQRSGRRLKEELRVMPVSGGTSRSVYLSDGFDVMGWSPDGKSVIIARG
jgi:Tol biopolymer transport system component